MVIASFFYVFKCFHIIDDYIYRCFHINDYPLIELNRL